MSQAFQSPRIRPTLVVLFVVLPLLWSAALVGAASWVRGHGGLASSLSRLARQVAFVAGRADFVPAAVAAVATAPTGDCAGCSTSGWVWASGSGGDRFSFALVEPGEGATVCSDLDESSHAIHELQQTATEPTVWFTTGGEEYIVRDHAVVQRAREICEPLMSLGRQMGEVGARQGLIGARLGVKGGKLGALGGRLGGLSARLALADLDRDERQRVRAEMAELQAEMDRVSSEMDRDGAGDRGEQQRLSRRMTDLSARHKAALARVRADLRKLLEDAKRDGKTETRGIDA